MLRLAVAGHRLVGGGHFKSWKGEPRSASAKPSGTSAEHRGCSYRAPHYSGIPARMPRDRTSAALDRSGIRFAANVSFPLEKKPQRATPMAPLAENKLFPRRTHKKSLFFR